MAPHGAEMTMTMLAFVVFVLTASSVKKVAPHRTETTIAFVVFVFMASSVKNLAPH